MKCPLCKKEDDLIFDSKGNAISCLCGWTYLEMPVKEKKTKFLHSGYNPMSSLYPQEEET